MGKHNKVIDVKKLFAAGFALMMLVSWGGLTYAQEALPEGIPPVKTDDPAAQSQQEREQFVKEIRRVENLNRKYTKQIDEIKELLAEKDADFQNRMKELEEKLARQEDDQNKKAVAQEQIRQTAQELESKTNEMLSKGGDLDPEDQQFKDELAKAHYNMGNIYYERGEYQRAVVEYYQAVDLAPNDPDTHYNLAFVSGEYLSDQETALKHYQWYLYLKPNADDSPLVNEKIIQAKLHLRSHVDSVLDKDNGHYNLTR
ncbi:MAG: tetratricopeptide repeat protein [Candidatus Omnitrophica bacterium]|nr:tetratricopeptide repeat protein [Candidatus Omnitrophota bacterium]